MPLLFPLTIENFIELPRRCMKNKVWSHFQLKTHQNDFIIIIIIFVLLKTQSVPCFCVCSFYQKQRKSSPCKIENMNNIQVSLGKNKSHWHFQIRTWRCFIGRAVQYRYVIKKQRKSSPCKIENMNNIQVSLGRNKSHWHFQIRTWRCFIGRAVQCSYVINFVRPLLEPTQTHRYHVSSTVSLCKLQLPDLIGATTSIQQLWFAPAALQLVTFSQNLGDTSRHLFLLLNCWKTQEHW